MRKVLTAEQAVAEEEDAVDSTEDSAEEEHQVPAAAQPDDTLADCYKEIFKDMEAPNIEVEVDLLEEEVNRYFKHKFNWQNIIREQGFEPQFVKEIGTESREWLMQFDELAENFEIMAWWEKCGKGLFPNIYVIACLILALPDSNGNQERTFSACTWMDGKLKKNQGEGTFQTKCVLYKTKKVRDQIAKHMMEDKELHNRQMRKMAREATRNLLELAHGVDEEDERSPEEESNSEVEATDKDNDSVKVEDHFHKQVMPVDTESEDE
jgi:hypothetical protein